MTIQQDGCRGGDKSRVPCYPVSYPADILGFTLEQRCLHFLWDALDRAPAGLIVDIAFPLRRAVAGRLFKSCGRHFYAEENTATLSWTRRAASSSVTSLG